MPKIITLLLLLLLSISAIAQKKEAKEDCPKVMDTLLHKIVYTFSEKMAEPIGGMDALHRTVIKKLKDPPSNLNINTKVTVKVVVEPNGKLSGKRLLNDPKGTALFFGKNILNIVDDVKWHPGECNGQKVAMYYTIPITLELGGNGVDNTTVIIH